MDIGAFELGLGNAPPLLAGDIDGNGAVDFADFLILSQNFGAVDVVWQDGDLDGNGEVGFADFLLLSKNFGNSMG